MTIDELPDNIREKILALKLKAATIQAAVDSCDGHLWKADYISKISSKEGSSVCVRCGERRAWINESEFMNAL